MHLFLLFTLIFFSNAKLIDDILREEDELDDSDIVDGIIELRSTTFKNIVESKQFTFVMLYDPTCKHCKALIPKFEIFGKLQKNNPNFKIARIDCDMYHSFCLKLKFLTGYPSLFLFYDGIVFPEYKLSYSPEAMKDWIELTVQQYHDNGDFFKERTKKFEL
ncbi:Protein disulfide isomerase [Entamoeba marina]